MTPHESSVCAIEYISARLETLLASQVRGIPAEATERIRELESALALANTKLIAAASADEQMRGALPALASAIEDCSAHFAQLIVDARAEIPLGAQTHITELEAKLAAAQTEAQTLRKQKDDAERVADRLDGLRAAAKRWRLDNYSPRLQSAIDAFLRDEVALK